MQTVQNMMRSHHLPKPLYFRNHLFLRHRTTTRPSSSQIRLFASQNTPLPRLKTSHSPPPMETAGAKSPKSDSPFPEDFVHVRNPEDSQITEDESNNSPSPSPSEKDSSWSSSDAIDDGGDDASEAPATNDFGVQVVHLPEELSKHVVLLECESTAKSGTCHVYVVGTTHVSQESCREVQAIIRHLKPQVVFLELCSSRAAILKPQKLQVPTMSKMIDMWKKGEMNTFDILNCWVLAKVADKLEVIPGSEFRVAFEEAMSYGAKVILGDRPIQITSWRTWGKMSLWHKAKFLFYGLWEAIFLPSPEELNKMLKEMDDVDILTLMIQEISRRFPTLMETLLFERDMYMSSKLLEVASEHSSVVAVVGQGHLPGIKKHWKQPIELKGLLDVPEASSGVSAMKILASVGVAVTGIAIISGIYLASKR